ncbi:hypothetical protein [Paenibacillus radicis (ex Gao et al. 2016)]|uniref:Uncharacterized protein n=1 Tax=Paenibacillus radicis (ex Gao et al. 2016) TaxID=1737354 RepID=A0A917LUU7_9BACL|nr:hypothetical protein [Paenibacillus radicis (ex Gao et al. 2016)]GGG58288.1 hypothetical protein GCM10010918_09190 [Paenibacillus radicis (ex Gao et al. 2016)]
MSQFISSCNTGGSRTGGNRTGGSRTGGSRTGGNRTGGSRTGGNRTGGSRTGNNRPYDPNHSHHSQRSNGDSTQAEQFNKDSDDDFE